MPHHGKEDTTKLVVCTTIGMDMDLTKRRITKIAREVQAYVRTRMKVQGVGSGECDILHLVRKNPGITQGEAGRRLMMDKAAITRRSLKLESKGFLRRERDEDDRRRMRLYATERCEEVKLTKAALESGFYGWLIEDRPKDELDVFLSVLERLYEKSKEESRAGFPHLR